MVLPLFADTKATPNVRIDVVEMAVVMSSEVILHSVPGVGKEVVVSLVVGGAVVIVNCLLTVVVGYYEVLEDVVPLLDGAGSPIPDLGHIHLSVPTVEGPVIT